MDVSSTYTTITQSIEQFCREAGRNPASVSLMAVSKGQDIGKIKTLYQLGHRYFGENYAPDLLAKAEAFAGQDIRWSFIGNLQSNKIARIMSVASEIQTLASEKHVRYVARYARELGKSRFPVFIEVNCGEAQKGGIPWGEVDNFAAFIQEEGLDSLDLQGLMAVPPTQDLSQIPYNSPPALYRDLAKKAAGIGKGMLSLGMSGDLGHAIHAGTNIVRIGSALFGPRNPT